MLEPRIPLVSVDLIEASSPECRSDEPSSRVGSDQAACMANKHAFHPCSSRCNRSKIKQET